MNRGELAARIDHTLLRADATAADVEALAAEALSHKFFGVCVASIHVLTAKRAVYGSAVRVISTVGFPLGASSRAVKRAEASHALVDGADELDMVMALGALKAGDDAAVVEDIRCVVDVAGDSALVKVILETALLSDDEIDRACRLAVDAGAGFVKTSTGFGPGGATVEAVARMRNAVGSGVGVKASGGIRDAESARRMLAAGASRLGTSASVAIMSGWPG